MDTINISNSATDPAILDLRGDGMPAAGAQIASAGNRCIAAAGDDQIRPGRLQARTGIPGRAERHEPELQRQADPREVDADELLGERQPGRLGKTDRLGRYSRLAVTQSPGHWRRTPWGFEQPGASVGETEAIASVYARRLYNSKDALGYMKIG